jgi:hypothetical protein
MAKDLEGNGSTNTDQREGAPVAPEKKKNRGSKETTNK